MIVLKNINYKSGSYKILQDINLMVNKGECLVITGKSGSGKTSLLKVINGLIPYQNPDNLEGDIFIDNINFKSIDFSEVGKIIASVFQDPRSQFFTNNTLDELVFACENYGIKPEVIHQRKEEIVNHFNLSSIIDKSIFKLSSGEKQKIAIAAALMVSPEVIVMDEPSANLDPEAIFELKLILQYMKNKNITVIIAEHRLFYLNKLADRIIHMDDGKIKHDCRLENPDRSFCKLYSDLSLRTSDLRKLSIRELNTEKGSESIRLKGISHKFSYKNSWLFQNLSLCFHAGEISCIAGNNGAGKTTLLKIISGISFSKKGRVEINSRKINKNRRLKEIGIVLQDPDYQLFSHSAFEELLLGYRKNSLNEEKAYRILNELLLFEHKDKHPNVLSLGQKQRLIIAVSLMRENRILLLDEPTSGMDLNTMLILSGILKKLALSGCTIIIVTHDYEFMTYAADRIIWLDQCKIREDTALNNASNSLLSYLCAD